MIANRFRNGRIATVIAGLARVPGIWNNQSLATPAAGNPSPIVRAMLTWPLRRTPQLCLALAWLACLPFVSSTGAAAAELPNIVLILSDDQAWTDYGFMGHKEIQTPCLDALASQSMVFPRGYVPTALCRPSLMTLVTGRYAHQHGVTGNDPSPKYADPKSAEYAERRAALISFIDRFETLPELLGERGYWSHQSGKWWEGSYGHGGFTHGMTRGFPQPGGRHGDDGLKIGRNGMQPVEDFVSTAVDSGKPFFLWYAPFLPHTPHNPPERLLAKYRSDDRPLPIARYYAMCEWFDETCGQLLACLDRHQVREKTLVVYVTDNGWIQNPDGNGYAPRSKQTPYEGGIRTPIMFSWPGHITPGKREDLVSSIDLMPTMLAAAKARIPEDLPGLNLLPCLTQGADIPRDTIFGEGFAHDIADVTRPEASLLYRWCIQGRWKLLLTYDGEVNRYASTHPRSERRPQLFDLLEDPGEEHNVAGEHGEIVASLARKIADWYPVKERTALTEFQDQP
jgi:arylsulfatase A-like enzyme